jgi:predicted nucleic acid-binding protein
LSDRINIRQVVADSTFYICFLEDINQPEKLIQLLKLFVFRITPIVYKEVSKCKNYVMVATSFPIVRHANTGEILRPFFSKKQIEKGETEVIELAYEFYSDGTPIPFILDDEEARHFVENNLRDLSSSMTGTVGFVGKCYYEFFVFTKEEASLTISTIGSSKFRISQEIISKVLSKVQSR